MTFFDQLDANYSKMTKNVTTDPNERSSTLVNRTEYQLYSYERRVIDFTEKRLVKMWNESLATKRKIELAALIEDYRSNSVAIAWQDGEPVFIRVVKDSAGKSIPVKTKKTDETLVK